MKGEYVLGHTHLSPLEEKGRQGLTKEPGLQ